MPRTLALVLSLFVGLVVAVPAAQADGPGALARSASPGWQQAVLERAAGAGPAVAARVVLPTRVAPSFGFQGPAPALRLTPAAPRIAPSAFRGFGGFAARVPVLPVEDAGALVAVDDDADPVALRSTEGAVVARKRIVVTRYRTWRPTYVAHQSSYYVPTYRWVDRCSTSCYRPVYRSCYRPYYRTCYRPLVRSCYSPCYGSCWGGDFAYGLGWGVGLGIGWGWGCGW